MPEELGKEILVEAAKAIAVEGYSDTLKPTFKSIGNILALPFQAVDAALAKPKLWVVEKQYNFEKTREILAHKMKDVPKEKIVPPENYVAVPALQQISYCFDSDELREMYANLLAASMNADLKWFVHPSYVDIIKQLTPDEAKLLKRLNGKENTYYPIIDVKINLGNEKGYIVQLYNYTTIAEGVCDCPQNINSYLENLERLKIIEIDKSQWIVDEDEYNKLKNSTIVTQLISAKLPEGQEYDFKRGYFHLTSFGYNFVEMCIRE